jgi:hypothetical protein
MQMTFDFSELLPKSHASSKDDQSSHLRNEALAVGAGVLALGALVLTRGRVGNLMADVFEGEGAFGKAGLQFADRVLGSGKAALKLGEAYEKLAGPSLESIVPIVNVAERGAVQSPVAALMNAAENGGMLKNVEAIMTGAEDARVKVDISNLRDFSPEVRNLLGLGPSREELLEKAENYYARAADRGNGAAAAKLFQMPIRPSNIGQTMHLPTSFPISETTAMDLFNKNRYLYFPNA